MLGDHFVQGRAKFNDHSPELIEPTAKVYVNVRFADLRETYVAQLDTGAAWSVLASSLVKKLGLSYGGRSFKLSTRFGVHSGHLVRIPITFVAQEGIHLDTDGTFFVSNDWPLDLTFLGYSGLLDSIRFALDPQANHFYFGSS
ncbi:MAG TPA: hypothetical protein VH988_26035 [Thermoanaerobaculia bacterium]|jgi:hypothetical protein|nr:hypothetical protein [Thermoanaerobaculia bacterium]